MLESFPPSAICSAKDLSCDAVHLASIEVQHEVAVRVPIGWLDKVSESISYARRDDKKMTHLRELSNFIPRFDVNACSPSFLLRTPPNPRERVLDFPTPLGGDQRSNKYEMAIDHHSTCVLRIKGSERGSADVV